MTTEDLHNLLNTALDKVLRKCTLRFEYQLARIVEAQGFAEIRIFRDNHFQFLLKLQYSNAMNDEALIDGLGAALAYDVPPQYLDSPGQYRTGLLAGRARLAPESRAWISNRVASEDDFNAYMQGWMEGARSVNRDHAIG